MEADSQRAHERRWWTLAVLCLSLTVISIDNTILNVALPSIVESLDARGSELQLLIDGYTIVFACLLLTAGSLGDKLGRKGILTAGLALFGAFSALAAFSTSSHMSLSSGVVGWVRRRGPTGPLAPQCGGVPTEHRLSERSESAPKRRRIDSWRRLRRSWSC